MGSRGTEIDGQSSAEGTPEDVAALYSWANLQGAKYRDYSASRREYRAQVRYRAAKALLERELKAQAEAEAAAADAERTDNPLARRQAPVSAEEAVRKAVADRVEAARWAEAAAHAAVLALREEREIAEAHISARRQALVYEEAEQRRRELAGPQPYGLPGNGHHAAGGREGDLRDEQADRLNRVLNTGRGDPEVRMPAREETEGGTIEEARGAGAGAEGEVAHTGPAWLYGTQTSPPVRAQAIEQTYPGEASARGDAVGGDTLQDSRERVAARWFALKGVFDQSWQELPAMQPIRTDNGRTQVLAVFSLAGGVGKTSLVATLGRALSSQGERVVLADTTSHGLLPIYFGEREARPGQVRTILQSEQSSNPAISLVSYDVARRGEDERQQEALVEEILRHGHGSDRLLLDLSSGLAWIIHRMANLHPTVVVPLAPDMNSVISLQAVERLFRGIADSDGRPLLPFYVLNQFDATLPLHLDVREVLRRQLGDRLLRFAIRRSAMVSEALAEGMTVVDYAPSAPVSQDILDVALWLRSISPQAAEVRGGRWGEP